MPSFNHIADLCLRPQGVPVADIKDADTRLRLECEVGAVVRGGRYVVPAIADNETRPVARTPARYSIIQREPAAEIICPRCGMRCRVTGCGHCTQIANNETRRAAKARLGRQGPEAVAAELVPFIYARGTFVYSWVNNRAKVYGVDCEKLWVALRALGVRITSDKRRVYVNRLADKRTARRVA